MAIIGYFICGDSVYRKVLLGLKRLRGTYIDLNLSGVILDALKEYNTEDRIFGIHKR